MTPNKQSPSPGFSAGRKKSAGFVLSALLALGSGPGLLAEAAALADPAAPTDDKVVELDTFVVSGIRSSMTAALDIKRESVQIVDSIVAQDIGKFPDNNLVEAMQRMTGIQVTNRGAGEIGIVAIRGLSDINTTLNGQNIFVSSGQAMALQDIPATLLARVDVFKTRSADLIENGIAGAVDIRTHRPFDFKGGRVSLSARGIYQEQSDEIGPNYSALFSQTWNTKGGKVGALINLSYVETPYRDQNVTAGAMVPFVTSTGAVTGGVNWVPYERIFLTRDGVAENPIWQAGLDEGLSTAPGSTLKINGVNVPYVLSRDAIFQNDFTGTRKRPSVNLALQWAPSENAEYTFEAFYFGYRNTSFNNLFFSFVDWWGGPHGAVELYPNTNIVKSRASTPNVYGFTSGDATESQTDSYSYSLSGKWNIGDALKLRSAATYQDSKFDTEFFAMRADRVHPAIAVDFNTGNGVPAFHFIDNPATAAVNESDMTQPGLWNVAQLYDNGDRDEGSAKTWTLDGDYETKLDFLPTLRFGVRYDDREASEAERRQESAGLGRSLTEFPELWHVNEGFFDGRSAVPSTWVVPNGLAIFRDADRYRGLYGRTKLPLVENFNVQEKNMAGYLRADFKTFLAGHKLDGQVGARYVSVKTDMNFGSESASAKKSKLLPSGSVRFQITPDLIARASYAETLRRPAFNQLNPNITYVNDVTNIGYGTATGGNPNLRPVESKNYDLALEWYFGRGNRSNVVHVTFFRREIDGLIEGFRRRVSAIVAPRTTPYDYILSQPDNASNGELEGFELGLQYFPDNLPGLLRGLGVQASYTTLDSSQDIPITNDAGQVTGTLNRPMFGVSDTSYSVTLAYEHRKISTTLSYVWRDNFLNNYEAALFANPLGIYRRAEESLDFHLSYRLSDRLELTLDATNLTEPLYQSYYGEGGATTNNFSSSLYSRTFALGARYSF